MDYVNVGGGGYISLQKIIAVFDYNVNLAKTRNLMREKKAQEKFMDFTESRACKTLILLTSGDLIGSPFSPEVIVKRIYSIVPNKFLKICNHSCINKDEIILITEKNNASRRLIATRNPVVIKLNPQKLNSVIWTNSGYVFFSVRNVKTLQNKVELNEK